MYVYAYIHTIYTYIRIHYHYITGETSLPFWFLPYSQCSTVCIHFSNIQEIGEGKKNSWSSVYLQSCALDT